MSERRITDNQPYRQEDRDAIYRVIAERRDMRHFSQEPLDPEILKRLFRVAHQAPSVGLMQPWRFLRITDRDLRDQICDLVESGTTGNSGCIG